MRGGNGQVVLISGEPGIGKSRLLWEFRTRWLEKHQAETGIWLESRCSPYFQNTSLYPIVGLLEQLLGFEAGDSPEVKRDKLDGTLARCDLTHPAASWLLSLLLGLPTDAPAPQTITADQRERMREMLVVLLQKQAARQPLVVVIEDLHWSDPTTVEWLGRSFDALAAVPCLVLLTCRPTFVSPWLPRAAPALAGARAAQPGPGREPGSRTSPATGRCPTRFASGSSDKPMASRSLWKS